MTNAATRLSPSQPIDQTAPSRNEGSRPRANNFRSIHRKATTATLRIAQGSTAARSTPSKLEPPPKANLKELLGAGVGR